MQLINKGLILVECGAMEEIAPIEMQWKVCPAKVYHKKAIFGWILIVVLGAFISSTSIILGILLTAVLVATQANFFFNSTFKINEEGLEAKYPFRTKKYTWKQVRRVKFFKDACYLFTRNKPSNLDGWSGIAVYYLDQRDRVVPAIKSHLLEGTAT